MPAVDAFDLNVTCINTTNAQLEWSLKQDISEDVNVLQLNIEFTCYNHSSGSPLVSQHIYIYIYIYITRLEYWTHHQTGLDYRELHRTNRLHH